MQDRETEVNQEKNSGLITDFLKRNWDIPGVIRVEDYSRAGYFGGVQKIVCSDSSFALKRHGTDTERELRFQHAVFEYLDTNGLTIYPPPLHTKGNRSILVDNASQLWVLSAWIEGRTLNTSDSTETEQQTVIAAATLARLHEATARFPMDDKTIVDHKMTEMWIPELLERIDKVSELVSSEKLPSFLIPYRREISRLLNSGEELIMSISDFRTIDQIEEGLSKTIIHGDTVPANIIFPVGDNSKCYLIDFDRVGYGRRLDDLTVILSDIERIKRGMGRIFLNAYSGKLPLNQYDIKHIDFMLRYGVLRRMFWYLNEIIKRNDPLRNYPLVLKDEIEWTTEVLETPNII